MQHFRIQCISHLVSHIIHFSFEHLCRFLHVFKSLLLVLLSWRDALLLGLSRGWGGMRTSQGQKDATRGGQGCYSLVMPWIILPSWASAAPDAGGVPMRMAGLSANAPRPSSSYSSCDIPHTFPSMEHHPLPPQWKNSSLLKCVIFTPLGHLLFYVVLWIFVYMS